MLARAKCRVQPVVKKASLEGVDAPLFFIPQLAGIFLRAGSASNTTMQFRNSRAVLAVHW